MGLIRTGLMVALLVPVHAVATPIPVGDPYQLGLHAETCQGCFGPMPNVTIDAVLDVVDVTGGNFPDPYYWWIGMSHSDVTMVTDFNGTMTIDDSPYDLTFAPHPRGDGSYILGRTGILTLAFAANGIASSLFNDRAYNLLYAPGVHQVPMALQWTRIETQTAHVVPDRVSTLALFAFALMGVHWLRPG